MIDETLKKWATPREASIIDAVNQCGSKRSAAKALGIAESGVRDGLTRLINRAAAQGYSPEHDLTHIIPEPYVARGHSTYYDKEGKPRQQWVKTRLDDQKWFDLLRETAAELAQDIPRLPPRASNYEADATGDLLCNQYTLTDVHLGMLAWKEEGGANWDLKIAESTVSDCLDHMMLKAPAAKRCVIAQIGDFLHSDGLVPVTPTSGHVLDQDSRYPKVVRAAIRVVRRAIERALNQHDTVDVLLAEGNHDPSGSVWLREMFAALYEDEPRVRVVTDSKPFYAIQHGKTGLFFHHGHKKKPADLPLLFAALFPEIWGSTAHRYAHTGHLHHVDEKERAGIQVFQHPTLAARDSHASRGGWLSRRQATSLTYHSEFGEVARNHVTPEMLRKL